MWKASLELGGLHVPVKLYAAVEEHGVHFRLLHAKDRVPVRQRMVNPRDGGEVPSEQIRRGLALDEGAIVVLRPEELASVAPASSRTIELLRFVPAEAIDVAWYARPYWLGPDGSAEGYFALARALGESGRRGIARWVMRGRRQFGALTPAGEHLALLALHAADEVVSARELARPPARAISAGERKLAEQLLAALDGPFEPSELRDDYRERVEKLVAAKRAGKRFTVKEAGPPHASGELGDVLRQSLRAAKGRRHAAA